MEREVFHIVQEYLNENKRFDISRISKKIQNYSKRNIININKEGIKVILQNLVKKKFIVEGSSLSRETILTNPTRKRIYNHVKKNPGTYFNQILKELRINNYLLVWHLDMLVKFHYINRVLYDNHNIYFVGDLKLEEVIVKYFTSKKKSREILQYLKENNWGISKTKISRELKMHSNTISRYLGQLEELKLIKKEQINKKNFYFLNSD